jgi:hypothetical protein
LSAAHRRRSGRLNFRCQGCAIFGSIGGISAFLYYERPLRSDLLEVFAIPVWPKPLVQGGVGPFERVTQVVEAREVERLIDNSSEEVLERHESPKHSIPARRRQLTVFRIRHGASIDDLKHAYGTVPLPSGQ